MRPACPALADAEHLTAVSAPTATTVITYHLLNRLGAGDGGRELAGLVQTGTEQTWDLLDHSLRGQESVVALGCTKFKAVDKQIACEPQGSRMHMQC